MLLLKTHSQLEKIAEDFLSKHGQLDGKRLMIELVVENYGYYIWPLHGLGEIAEAFVPRKPGIIFVDEEQMLEHPIRFRFTLAEELAHILIHASRLRGMSLEELDRFNDMMTAGQYRLYEHNAKYLGSCLLMRKSAFVELFHSYCAIQEKRVSNRSKVLRYAMRQLAMDFCVTPAAASQHAFRLHLISEADFTELNYYFT